MCMPQAYSADFILANTYDITLPFVYGAFIKNFKMHLGKLLIQMWVYNFE